jgi:hypothetical protein
MYDLLGEPVLLSSETTDITPPILRSGRMSRVLLREERQGVYSLHYASMIKIYYSIEKGEELNDNGDYGASPSHVVFDGKRYETLPGFWPTLKGVHSQNKWGIVGIVASHIGTNNFYYGLCWIDDSPLHFCRLSHRERRFNRSEFEGLQKAVRDASHHRHARVNDVIAVKKTNGVLVNLGAFSFTLRHPHKILSV